MFWFAQIVLIILLLILVFQDFKTREISLLVLVGVFACNLFIFLISPNVKEFFHALYINILFLCFLFLALTIYVSFKEKKLTLIADKYLGWGDIIFLFTLSLSFSTINFIVFLVTSFVFTLVAYITLKLLKPNLKKEIPLVGFLAITLILVRISTWVNPQFTFYNENWLISFSNLHA